MEIFKKEIHLRLSIIILIVLVLSIVLIGGLYFMGYYNNPKIETILAGIITGLFVAIIQFLIAWNSFKANEKINSLKIIEVLDNRDNRNFYRDFILSAEDKIDIMGNTANRFFEHFADMESSAKDEAKVLFNRLAKEVKVRVLLPQKEFVSEDGKNNTDKVNKILIRISNDYETFEYKYFNHSPNHSVFRVDDKCIVGPKFENSSSKNTPSIYLKNKSPFAKKYINHFDTEWEKADFRL